MASFIVTTSADSGAGSLRQAIIDANAAGGVDNITFDAGLAGQTITLASDLPQIVGDTIIDGSGAAGVTVDGADLHRVFWAALGDITIQDLTIANGLAQGGEGGDGWSAGGGGAGLGGGLFVDQGADVVLRDVTFTGNAAVGGRGGDEANFHGGGGGGMGANGQDSADADPGDGGGPNGGLSGTPASPVGVNGGAFSGGGGGMANGGAGGFGGGGGGGGGYNNGLGDTTDVPGEGGAGGFGGGGGGSFLRADALGGYGGGYSSSALGNGGGGAGLGGAVFVRQGGSISLIDVEFGAGNAVQGGAAPADAQAGRGEGANLFLMGGGDLVYTVSTGRTQTLIGGFEANNATVQLTKAGDGLLVMAAGGTSDLGPVTVAAGVLRVDGVLTGSSTSVESGATLQGTGTVQDVTVLSGGTLAPGASPGVLASGDLSMLAGSAFEAELAGTGAGQFDRVNVTGTVDLGGATLDIVFFGGFAPVVGNSFLLIDNDGVDAVVGAFSGFAQGAAVTIGGLNYTVSYTGGTGNDVTLTVSAIPPPPPPPSPPREIPTLGGEDGDLALLSSGDNSYAGGGGADLILGLGGDDVLQGNVGADSLDGGAGDDVVYGGRDDDLVDGGADDDWLYGDLGNDQVLGGSGDDVIQGGAGNDLCEGGEGADIVRGGQGADTIQGGDGNDWLSGDLGDDLLTGGLGADTFHIFANAGTDRVTDFSVTDGDRVQLLPGAAYSLSQVGADTVVDLGTGKLVLQNVQLSSLPEGWVFGA